MQTKNKAKGLLVHRVTDPRNMDVAEQNQFILIWDNSPDLFAPTESTPALYLAEKDVYGRKYLCCFPDRETALSASKKHTDPNYSCNGYMFSGDFIYTCDSRFPCQYPIPIHNRKEA